MSQGLRAGRRRPAGRLRLRARPPLPGRPAGRRPVAAAGGPVLDDGDLLAFGPAADADLELIHDRDYLEALARFAAPGAGAADPAEAARFGLVGDNRPFPGMDEAGRLVAGATIAAVDTVAGGDLAHAFAPWPACTTPSGAGRSASAWSTTWPWPSPAAPGPGRCGCCTSTWTPT